MKRARLKFAAIALVPVLILLDWYLGQKLIPENFRIKDPVFHHAFKKNFQGLSNWCGLTYSFYTNSLGFRDASSRAVKAQSHKPRIIFIGDSFAEGLGLAYELTAVGRLAKELQAQGIEVLNAAAVSYCPKLYYLKIKYYLEERKLSFNELYVLLDVADIFDENIFSAYSPAPKRSLNSRDIIPWLNHNSFTFHTFYTLGSRLKNSGLRYLHRPGEEMHPLERDYTERREEWTLDPDLYEKWAREGINLAEKNLEELWQLCQKHHIRMHIVVYPWPYQIIHQDRNSLQELRWRSFTQARGIGFLDLFPVFLEAGSPTEVINKYFINNDDHWNEAGNALVAEALIAYYNKTARE